MTSPAGLIVGVIVAMAVGYVLELRAERTPGGQRRFRREDVLALGTVAAS